MTKCTKTSRSISFLLSLLMLLSVFALPAFASESVKLKDGTAKITAEMTTAQVKEALFAALVANPEGQDAQALEWEYGCDGYNGLLKNWAYGSVEGFTSKKLLTVYTHPSIAEIAEGTYNVRLKGSEDFVRLTKTVKDVPNTQIVLKETTEPVKLYLRDDLSTNFARFKTDLFNAVFDAEKSAPSNLTADDVDILYDASRLNTVPIWHDFDFVDSTNIQKPLAEGGQFRFKMIVPETASYHGATVEFYATVQNAPRVESSISFTDKPVTYTGDAEALKASIFNTCIDWKTSVLPNQKDYNQDYYTVEYYAENLVAGKPGGIKKWVPLEGGTFALLYYPAITAGEHQIRITFKGNAKYASATAEKTVVINKAKTQVFVKSTNKFADEKLPADFITTSSKDPFEFYTIYVGVTNSKYGNIYIDLPDSITESVLIDLLNPIVKLVVGKSMDEIINNGITLEEINAVVNSQAMKDLIAAFNIDLGAMKTVLEVLEKLPPTLQKINITLTEPNLAGLYTVVALAINPNYETGVGVGALLVKMRTDSVVLKFNQEMKEKTITAEEAKTFDFGATLTYKDTPVANQNTVNYLYTGVKADGRPYASSSTAPTEPGRYLQTVTVIGGNYQAAPVSRTFTIQ